MNNQNIDCIHFILKSTMHTYTQNQNMAWSSYEHDGHSQSCVANERLSSKTIVFLIVCDIKIVWHVQHTDSISSSPGNRLKLLLQSLKRPKVHDVAKRVKMHALTGRGITLWKLELPQQASCVQNVCVCLCVCECVGWRTHYSDLQYGSQIHNQEEDQSNTRPNRTVFDRLSLSVHRRRISHTIVPWTNLKSFDSSSPVFCVDQG